MVNGFPDPPPMVDENRAVRLGSSMEVNVCSLRSSKYMAAVIFSVSVSFGLPGR